MNNQLTNGSRHRIDKYNREYKEGIKIFGKDAYRLKLKGEVGIERKKHGIV